MAKLLNKNRIKLSKIIIISAILLIFLTREMTQGETAAHEVLDLTGYFLLVICGMGRLYTTAFLGGHKNKELITAGPFSIVRNPLYVCSWLGFTGFALFSNNVWVIAIVPLSFLALYHFLVKREENFLIDKFGDAYKDYCVRVPRFIPRFSLFSQPDEIVLAPSNFLRGLMDNVWWFVIPPLLEFLEGLTDIEIL